MIDNFSSLWRVKSHLTSRDNTLKLGLVDDSEGFKYYTVVFYITAGSAKYVFMDSWIPVFIQNIY